MKSKIKLAAVSYLNTKPMLYGIERSPLMQDVELILDYPARLLPLLLHGQADAALLPVAALAAVPQAKITADYGIGADGTVASVCLFSQVPLHEVKKVYLDFQSRTSVALAQLLFARHWKHNVVFLPAPENYIDYINGETAGVIIGDRALQQRENFEYIYDLSEAWKEYSGLPFVFAAWVTDRELPEGFREALNEACAYGLRNLEEVVAENKFPYYDLSVYYKHNIVYRLDEAMHAGLRRFLGEMAELPGLVASRPV